MSPSSPALVAFCRQDVRSPEFTRFSSEPALQPYDQDNQSSLALAEKESDGAGAVASPLRNWTFDSRSAARGKSRGLLLSSRNERCEG